MELGRIGVWRSKRHGAGDLKQLEALGYTAFWIGGSPSVEEARPYLEDGDTITVATGILNVWQHTPQDVAAAQQQLVADFPDRFLLGIGIGHPEATSDYTRPLKTMREFFDGLDVPKDQLVAAALGPKMLDLAAERSLGTHPYFITPEHTKFARERVGEGVLVAPEVAVVVEPDPETARAHRPRLREALPRPPELHEQPAQLRLHRAGHRGRRLRPPDRRRDPERQRRADRGAAPRPLRSGRGPHLRPAPRSRAATGP